MTTTRAPAFVDRSPGHFASVLTELWIAKHLGNRALFAGVTTPTDRRERVRKEILMRKLERAQAGVRKNRPESWSQLFERVYGEKLDASPQLTLGETP